MRRIDKDQGRLDYKIIKRRSKLPSICGKQKDVRRYVRRREDTIKIPSMHGLSGDKMFCSASTGRRIHN